MAEVDVVAAICSSRGAEVGMHDPIAIARARSLPHLRRTMASGWPRVAVGAMLAFTALAGFLCSVALLHLGIGGMGLRYAMSVVVAYAVFLAQLRVWVAIVRRRRSVDPDVPDVSDILDAEVPARWGPGAGRFAGGGASGSFAPPAGIDPSAAPDAGSSAGDALSVGFDVDLDSWQLVAVAVLAVLVACGAIAAGYVVYTAPTLLAEVFFDGVVASVLYRRLRRGSARAWWQGALSRTWVAALVVFVFFGIGGLILDRAVPGARSIGDVLRAITG